jgi:MoaE-MoaD fusion protein
MQVRVLYFGMLRDFAGQSVENIDLLDGATLGDAFERCKQSVPELARFAGSIAMSVNQEYAGPQTPLKQGDEIAFLPPVSGGTPEVGIVKEPIKSDAIISRMKYPEDGACVVFEGIVRNETRGRRTLFLDYEAYEEMALKQMQELVSRALVEFEVRDVAIVHRIGRLEIGETSVLIVVTSAHRGAAFDACRWLIDTLKKTVPIWKKEHFEDGAVWTDGEPFPADVIGDAIKAEGSHSGKPASTSK